MTLKINSSTVVLFVAFSFILTCSFNIQQLVRTDIGLNTQKHDNKIIQVPQADCTAPLLYENIDNFTLPLKDVKYLLDNQFSKNSLDNINAPHKIILFNIKYESKLLSNGQSQSYTTPLKAKVVNDQTQFTFSYQINITQGVIPKHKTFNVTTTVKNIVFTYEKEFKTDTGSSLIDTVAIKFTADMMSSQFSHQPTADEEKKFQTAIKGASPSLFDSFNKLLGVNQVKQYMQSNIKNQHLSKIYDQNPYVYTYYNYSMNIDVSTLSISVNAQNSLLNGLSGKLPANQFCSNFTPDFTNTGSNMFIPVEFIQNFISYTINNFKDWKSVTLDKSWIRSNIIQFLLPDLQYVVDGIYRDLADYIQNQMYYGCSATSNQDTQLDSTQKVMYSVMKWKCAGFIKINESTSVKVLGIYFHNIKDFQPRIKYTVLFSVTPSRLDVLANKLEFIDCIFNDVDSFDGKGKYHVMNGKLAQKYIESTFNDMRRWSVGSFFKLHPSSSGFKVEQNRRGLWIL